MRPLVTILNASDYTGADSTLKSYWGFGAYLSPPSEKLPFRDCWWILITSISEKLPHFKSIQFSVCQQSMKHGVWGWGGGESGPLGCEKVDWMWYVHEDWRGGGFSSFLKGFFFFLKFILPYADFIALILPVFLILCVFVRQGERGTWATKRLRESRERKCSRTNMLHVRDCLNYNVFLLSRGFPLCYGLSFTRQRGYGGGGSGGCETQVFENASGVFWRVLKMLCDSLSCKYKPGDFRKRWHHCQLLSVY